MIKCTGSRSYAPRRATFLTRLQMSGLLYTSVGSNDAFYVNAILSANGFTPVVGHADRVSAAFVFNGLAEV